MMSKFQYVARGRYFGDKSIRMFGKLVKNYQFGAWANPRMCLDLHLTFGKIEAKSELDSG